MALELLISQTIIRKLEPITGGPTGELGPVTSDPTGELGPVIKLN